MALIFLRVRIVFTVSSFEFQQVIANDEWLQFTQPQSTGLSDLGAMLESYYKLQQKPKTDAEFKNALQLIWLALPEKAIDNAVKNHRMRLQACVSNNGHFKHFM